MSDQHPAGTDNVPPRPAAGSSGPTLLLVDDDAGVRRVMARLLALEGFGIVEAGNGEEALVHLRAGCGAAAIVLDLRMPVMDGWTFRRLQRSDPAIAHVPVVVLSGADTHRFAELEAAAAFEKPARMSQIAAFLRDLLGCRQAEVRPPDVRPDVL